jgi:hypothetical protein
MWKIGVAKKTGRFVFVVALHTAMYSLAARWLRTNQRKTKQSRRENQRVSGIANWVETERDKTKQNRKKIKNNARGFEGDRECRHKIIPGYHFVLTIASPPMT